jgi:sugar phosphate isomerase/epimerase
MTNALPKIGAAMRIESLPQHIDWLLAGQRDLEIQDGAYFEVLDGDWRGLAYQARQVLDGHQGRLGIHGPFISLTLLARDPKIRTVVSDRLRQGLDFAHALGATHMVLHSPFDFFGNPFLPHSPGHGQADQLETIHTLLDPLLPIAQAANCTLVVETIHDTHPGPLLALIRSFNSPFVRMSLDTGHAFIKHLVGGPPPDLWVREAGELLGHLHIQDTDGQLDRHWPPGYGRINWYALFEALRTLQQSPRLVLELRNHADIPRGAQWLVAQGLVT